jgi:hypothetical protein
MYLVVWLDIHEERGQHADRLLPGNVSLRDRYTYNGGKVQAKATYDFGLEYKERVKLFKFRLLAQDLFWDVELPCQAVRVPRRR